jgi:hypothetical protein
MKKVLAVLARPVLHRGCNPEAGSAMTPFVSKNDASYWGGGQIVPFQGGYVSLHAVSTPFGVDTYTVAASGRKSGLIPGYVFATPEGGGAKCICEYYNATNHMAR